MNVSALRTAAATSLLALGLSACVTPQALRGDFAVVTPAQAGTGSGVGDHVRWGGTLLSMSNHDGIGCIEVLARPLDSTGRPVDSQHDLGRFLACGAGYNDPQTYLTGRLVSVVGEVTGGEMRRLGKDQLPYAKLKAEQIYLWQDQAEPTVVYAYDPFFNPYEYPYPYYSAPGYYQYQAPAAPIRAASVGGDGTLMGLPMRSMSPSFHLGGLFGGH